MGAGRSAVFVRLLIVRARYRWSSETRFQSNESAFTYQKQYLPGFDVQDWEWPQELSRLSLWPLRTGGATNGTNSEGGVLKLRTPKTYERDRSAFDKRSGPVVPPPPLSNRTSTATLGPLSTLPIEGGDAGKVVGNNERTNAPKHLREFNEHAINQLETNIGNKIKELESRLADPTLDPSLRASLERILKMQKKSIWLS